VTGQPEKEYLYITDPIAKAPTGGTAADNGLVDLLAIDNRGTLLALERSFAVGQGNTIKIYEITLQGATDINTVDSLGSLNANQLAAIQPAQKRLLLNLDSLNLPNSDGNHPTGTDNIEGLAFGPKYEWGVALFAGLAMETLSGLSYQNKPIFFNPQLQLHYFLFRE
jgi:3-phytase/alkaline phosphatase D